MDDIVSKNLIEFCTPNEKKQIQKYAYRTCLNPQILFNISESITKSEKREKAMIKDITNTFIKLILKDIKQDIKTINKKNATPYYINNNLCATHEYVDTNMYLLKAIRKHNINYKISSNEFFTLCNKIHTLAIKNNFMEFTFSQMER